MHIALAGLVCEMCLRVLVQSPVCQNSKRSLDQRQQSLHLRCSQRHACRQRGSRSRHDFLPARLRRGAAAAAVVGLTADAGGRLAAIPAGADALVPAGLQLRSTPKRASPCPPAVAQACAQGGRWRRCLSALGMTCTRARSTAHCSCAG